MGYGGWWGGGGEAPVNIPIRRTAPPWRHTVFMSSLQMTRKKACSDTEFPLPMPGIDPGNFRFRGQCAHHYRAFWTWTLANSADPVQASDQGLHCLLKLQDVKVKWNSLVAVQDHFHSLHSETIDPPVLSLLWLQHELGTVPKTLHVHPAETDQSDQPSLKTVWILGYPQRVLRRDWSVCGRLASISSD